MFGTLKPRLCHLSDEDEAAYRRFYCGVCKGLGEQYGTPLRATLTHDAVLLAVVADGLLDEAAAPSSCRCPLNPLVRRPTAAASSAAIRWAAGLQLLLGDQWLADRAAEGSRGARLARSLVGTRVERARGQLVGLGSDPRPLERFEERQASVELTGAAPQAAAEPTARALAHVFEQIATLPGASDELRAPDNRRGLAGLGHAVGRSIYHLDALEDLRADYVDGRFNPCVTRAGAHVELSRSRVEDCAAQLEAAVEEVGARVAALPWRRHRALVEEVLVARLRLIAADATRFAQATFHAGELARLDAFRSTSRPWRFVVGLFVAARRLGASVLASVREGRGARSGGRHGPPPIPPGQGRAAGAEGGGGARGGGPREPTGAPGGPEPTGPRRWFLRILLGLSTLWATVGTLLVLKKPGGRHGTEAPSFSDDVREVCTLEVGPCSPEARYERAEVARRAEEEAARQRAECSRMWNCCTSCGTDCCGTCCR